MNFGSIRIPALFYGMAIIYLLYCFLFTPNILITIPIVIFPLFVYRLFWVSKQTNVLFWGMLLQWTLPAAQLLYCNFYSITLAERMEDQPLYAKTAETATLLNIFGLYAFSIGMFLAVKGLSRHRIVTSIANYLPRRVLILYIFFSVIILVLGNIIWAFPGLVQFIFVFFYIKWGLFLIAFYVIYKYGPTYKWHFFGFVLLELMLGLSSFFAGQIIFIILFTAVAAVRVQPKLGFRTTIVLTIAALLVINYLIIWTAIKKEYRDYVSKGLVTQSVQVTSGEARNKLVDLFLNLDAKGFQAGLDQLVDRVGYIHFFAASINHVPRVLPYQGGDVYWSVVQHYAIPRFLNPDKKILDDSEHTSKYTGLRLTGAKKATSFSLGYITDAYVDFGPVGMHFLLFFVGLLFGVCFRFLVVKSPNDFWVTVLTGPFLIILNINGADTKKALGGLMLYIIIIFVVRKPLIRLVESYLKPGVQ